MELQLDVSKLTLDLGALIQEADAMVKRLEDAQEVSQSTMRLEVSV
jgi:hypothetical protein